jgi:hypothetical protein
MTEISKVAGIILSITLIMVVIGVSKTRSYKLWIMICFITMVNLFTALFFYPYGRFKPMMVSPFVLTEIVVFFVILGKIT